MDTKKPHCWHIIYGMVYSCEPPLSTEVCCFCGARRNKHMRQPAGHGAFAPVTIDNPFYTYHQGVDRDHCSKHGEAIKT